jgi:hypothetical protein
MLQKSMVLDTINNFNEEFSVDYLIEKMLFIEHVQEGMEQSKKGEVISEEAFKEKIKEWFK